MAVGYNPRTVTDGLVLALDAGNPKNYNVGISTNWVDNVGGNNGTLVNGTYHTDGPFVGAGYVEFVGTGDAISAPAGSDFAYGTGDFTIEGWFYPTVIGQVSGAGYPSHILFGQTVAATNYLLFGIDANGKLLYYRTSAGGGSDQFSSAPNGSVVLNKWQHIALCRSSGTTKAFVDGQEIISISDTFNFNNTDRNPTIGNYTHTLTTQPFNGYISNFRILKGTGLYTSNFTPPTKPLTAVTNTVLLTCQGNTIIDASSSGHTLTASGDISLTKEPFAGAGAVKFDGTGDYLSVPQSTDFQFSSSAIDFTIEAHVYGSAFSGAFTTIAAVWGGGGSEGQWLFSVNASGVLGFAWNPYSNSANFISGGTLSTNTWYHVAVTRSGNTFRLFVDGAQTASGTDSGTNSNNTQLSIGRYAIGSSAYDSNEWEGYISNVRVIKGTALYTSNFTPPTAPLTAVTNTVLLTCQGNTIADASSSAHTITASGDAAANLGFPKSAFEFDGTDDYITLPTNFFSFPSQTTFTISLWFKSSQTTGGTLFGQTNNSNPITASGYVPVIYLKTDGSIRIEPFWTGNAGNSIESSSGLNDNNWHNIITTFNSGTNQLYIDGSYVSQRAGLNLVSFTSTYYYFVGAGREGNRNLGTDVFSGNISNFSFYNKALSGAEVKQNYNALRGRYGI